MTALEGDPVAQTEVWLREFIVRLDLCPFAAAPLRVGRVRVVAARSCVMEEMLAELLGEAEILREGGVATTLFVVPSADAGAGLLDDWDTFQDVLAFAEDLLEQTGYADFVQLVGFHPDYLFGDAPEDDPAHATNRSPHPMIHLLDREDVAAAVAAHPDIEGIPRRNVELLRARAASGD